MTTTRLIHFDDPEPAVWSVVRTIGGWEAPDSSAVAHRWPDGWYVAGSSRLYDWPSLFVGWDRVTLIHDAAIKETAMIDHAHVAAVKAEWAKHQRGNYCITQVFGCDRCEGFRDALAALRKAIREEGRDD